MEQILEMRPSRFHVQEVRLEAERSVKYKGAAGVKLEVVLHSQRNKPRELSRKIFERLKETFRTDNIHRLEPRNHMPATIDQCDLDNVIQVSEISKDKDIALRRYVAYLYEYSKSN